MYITKILLKMLNRRKNVKSYKVTHLSMCCHMHGKRSTKLRPTCMNDMKPNAKFTHSWEQVKFVFSNNVGVMCCVYIHLHTATSNQMNRIAVWKWLMTSMVWISIFVLFWSTYYFHNMFLEFSYIFLSFLICWHKSWFFAVCHTRPKQSRVPNNIEIVGKYKTLWNEAAFSHLIYLKI